MLTKYKYLFVHPESAIGLMYSSGGVEGDGHPDWILIGISQHGTYMLRRKTWVEKLFGF